MKYKGVAVSAVMNEIDERLWEFYLQECRATNTKPSLRDFAVWAQDQDFDMEPPEQPEREEPDVD